MTGKGRQFIKGQRYTLLSHKRNLTLQGRKGLKLLLAANKRLNTAYVLKEQFEQLWEYKTPGGARRFFERWRDALKWQRRRLRVGPVPARDGSAPARGGRRDGARFGDKSWPFLLKTAQCH